MAKISKFAIIFIDLLCCSLLGVISILTNNFITLQLKLNVNIVMSNIIDKLFKCIIDKGRIYGFYLDKMMHYEWMLGFPNKCKPYLQKTLVSQMHNIIKSFIIYIIKIYHKRIHNIILCLIIFYFAYYSLYIGG